MTASVKTVMATVPENVPRPNRNVASSARISAGNERSTCTRKRSTARTGAGHGRLCAHSGAEAERQRDAQRRTGDRHSQRRQQRRHDRGQIAPVRREELRGNVAQVCPPRPEHRGSQPVSQKASTNSASTPSARAQRFARARVMARPRFPRRHRCVQDLRPSRHRARSRARSAPHADRGAGRKPPGSGRDYDCS